MVYIEDVYNMLKWFVFTDNILRTAMYRTMMYTSMRELFYITTCCCY